MKRYLAAVALAALLACHHVTPVPTPRAVVAAQPEHLDASSPLHDHGTFKLLQDEELIDQTEFTLDSPGAYRAHSHQEDTEVTPGPEPRGWRRASLRVTSHEELRFEHAGHDVVSSVGTRLTRFTVGEDAFFLEPHAPALLELVLRAYDARTGGLQRIPAFLAPALPTEAVITRGRPSERLLGGARVTLFDFEVSLAGVVTRVVADGAGRIYQAVIPSEHLRFVREGFEPEFAPPSAPGTTHAVTVNRNEWAPMRDGTQLATDLYRPSDLPRAPALLLRTELGKDAFAPTARFYARRGYVVAVQDMRGRGASQGAWAPFTREAQDGDDSVVWLAQHAGVAGGVALLGDGYGAWAALATLGQRPAALEAVVSSNALTHPLPELAGLEVPVLHLGQQPRHASGALRDFTSLATRAQKLVVTGAPSEVDLPNEALRWLDHHLRSIDNGVEREPRVQLAIQGSSETLRADAYPLATELAPRSRWYLSSGGKAVSSLGDGTLSGEPPRAGRPDHYTFDPSSPTPDPEVFAPGVDEDPRAEHSFAEEQVRRLGNHEDVVSNRQDVLAYATAPLSQPMTLVGPVQLTLFMQRQGPNAALCASLVEVDAHGFVTELARGEARSGAPDASKKPMSVTVDLGDVAVNVPAGHRLRVEIASARLGPAQSVTAGNSKTEVRVHHARGAESYLELREWRAPGK